MSDAASTDKEFWNNRWVKNAIEFHRPVPNDVLLQSLQYWTPVSDKSTAPVVFIPLCGKTLDLLYLAQQGYRVCGVEFIQRAAEDFFNEHINEVGRMKTEQRTSDCLVLSSEKLPIIIYVCDIFHPELRHFIQEDHHAPVSHIWDRGSFVAINPNDRLRYLKSLLPLLPPPAPGHEDDHHHTDRVQWLIANAVYPASIANGPPHTVIDGNLRDLIRQAQEDNSSASAINSTLPVSNKEDLATETVRTFAVVGDGRTVEGEFEVRLLNDIEKPLPPSLKTTVANFVGRDRVYGISRIKGQLEVKQ